MEADTMSEVAPIEIAQPREAPRRKEKLVVTASSAYALIYILTRTNSGKQQTQANKPSQANKPCTNQRAIAVSRP